MKTKYYLLLILIAICFTQTTTLLAQAKVDKAFKEKTVQEIDKLINAHYVFPEVAKKTGDHLKKQLKKGAFDQTNDIETFSKALTQELQSVNKDKHMAVHAMPQREQNNSVPSQEDQINFMLRNLKSAKETTAGFAEAKKLKGNIGYLDLRGFAQPTAGIPIADAYMKLLQNSDAIIIDLRKNGGGSPEMVQYLSSFFFDKKVHLNSLYYRKDNSTKEFWTLDKVNGEKLPDVPLFVLTSSYTFSGAEEFSYNMQTQQRATLIGETTGGGANPGGMHKINEQLGMFIPGGTAINPVTKKNWEGTGVTPEVKTSAEAAFDKGLELATAAAENYRQARYTAGKNLFTTLFEKLDNIPATAYSNQQLEEITALFKQAVNKGLLNEGDINMLGYEDMAANKATRAEIILKANTLLFPDSPNTYDSYAEALAKNNKKDLALQAYEKAVETATKNNDPGIEMYKKNLASFEGKNLVKR